MTVEDQGKCQTSTTEQLSAIFALDVCTEEKTFCLGPIVSIGISRN